MTRPLAFAVRTAGVRAGRLGLSALLGAGAVAAAVALLATSGWLISRAAEQPPILTLTVAIAIVGVRAFSVVRAALRYAERLVSHDLAFRGLASVRMRFFSALAPLVPGDLRLRGGDLLSRFVADVDRLQDLYVRAHASARGRRDRRAPRRRRRLAAPADRGGRPRGGAAARRRGRPAASRRGGP